MSDNEFDYYDDDIMETANDFEEFDQDEDNQVFLNGREMIENQLNSPSLQKNDSPSQHTFKIDQSDYSDHYFNHDDDEEEEVEPVIKFNSVVSDNNAQVQSENVTVETELQNLQNSKLDSAASEVNAENEHYYDEDIYSSHNSRADILVEKDNAESDIVAINVEQDNKGKDHSSLQVLVIENKPIIQQNDDDEDYYEASFEDAPPDSPLKQKDNKMQEENVVTDSAKHQEAQSQNIEGSSSSVAHTAQEILTDDGYIYDDEDETVLTNKPSAVALPSDVDEFAATARSNHSDINNDDAFVETYTHDSQDEVGEDPTVQLHGLPLSDHPDRLDDPMPASSISRHLIQDEPDDYMTYYEQEIFDAPSNVTSPNKTQHVMDENYDDETDQFMSDANDFEEVQNEKEEVDMLSQSIRNNRGQGHKADSFKMTTEVVSEEVVFEEIESESVQITQPQTPEQQRIPTVENSLKSDKQHNESTNSVDQNVIVSLPSEAYISQLLADNETIIKSSTPPASEITPHFSVLDDLKAQSIYTVTTSPLPTLHKIYSDNTHSSPNSAVVVPSLNLDLGQNKSGVDTSKLGNLKDKVKRHNRNTIVQNTVVSANVETNSIQQKQQPQSILPSIQQNKSQHSTQHTSNLPSLFSNKQPVVPISGTNSDEELMSILSGNAVPKPQNQQQDTGATAGARHNKRGGLHPTMIIMKSTATPQGNSITTGGGSVQQAVSQSRRKAVDINEPSKVPIKPQVKAAPQRNNRPQQSIVIVPKHNKQQNVLLKPTTVVPVEESPVSTVPQSTHRRQAVNTHQFVSAAMSLEQSGTDALDSLTKHTDIVPSLDLQQSQQNVREHSNQLQGLVTPPTQPAQSVVDNVETSRSLPTKPAKARPSLYAAPAHRQRASIYQPQPPAGNSNNINKHKPVRQSIYQPQTGGQRNNVISSQVNSTVASQVNSSNQLTTETTDTVITSSVVKKTRISTTDSDEELLSFLSQDSPTVPVLNGVKRRESKLNKPAIAQQGNKQNVNRQSKIVSTHQRHTQLQQPQPPPQPQPIITEVMTQVKVVSQKSIKRTSFAELDDVAEIDPYLPVKEEIETASFKKVPTKKSPRMRSPPPPNVTLDNDYEHSNGYQNDDDDNEYEDHFEEDVSPAKSVNSGVKHKSSRNRDINEDEYTVDVEDTSIVDNSTPIKSSNKVVSKQLSFSTYDELVEDEVVEDVVEETILDETESNVQEGEDQSIAEELQHETPIKQKQVGNGNAKNKVVGTTKQQTVSALKSKVHAQPLQTNVSPQNKSQTPRYLSPTRSYSQNINSSNSYATLNSQLNAQLEHSHSPDGSQVSGLTNYDMQSPVHTVKPTPIPPAPRPYQPPKHQREIAGVNNNKLWTHDPNHIYDEGSGLFSTFEVSALRESRIEQQRLNNLEKKRIKDLEIETARYSYMKRNQELMIEQHQRNLRLINNAIHREDKVELLRAQHIVAQNKIHYELEEIRLKMEYLTQAAGNYKGQYIKMTGNIITPAPTAPSAAQSQQQPFYRRPVKYVNPKAVLPQSQQVQYMQPQQQHSGNSNSGTNGNGTHYFEKYTDESQPETSSHKNDHNHSTHSNEGTSHITTSKSIQQSSVKPRIIRKPVPPPKPVYINPVAVVPKSKIQSKQQTPLIQSVLSDERSVEDGTVNRKSPVVGLNTHPHSSTHSSIEIHDFYDGDETDGVGDLNGDKGETLEDVFRSYQQSAENSLTDLNVTGETLDGVSPPNTFQNIGSAMDSHIHRQKKLLFSIADSPPQTHTKSHNNAENNTHFSPVASHSAEKTAKSSMKTSSQSQSHVVHMAKDKTTKSPETLEWERRQSITIGDDHKPHVGFSPPPEKIAQEGKVKSIKRQSTPGRLAMKLLHGRESGSPGYVDEDEEDMREEGDNDDINYTLQFDQFKNNDDNLYLSTSILNSSKQGEHHFKDTRNSLEYSHDFDTSMSNTNYSQSITQFDLKGSTVHMSVSGKEILREVSTERTVYSPLIVQKSFTPQKIATKTVEVDSDEYSYDVNEFEDEAPKIVTVSKVTEQDNAANVDVVSSQVTSASVDESHVVTNAEPEVEEYGYDDEDFETQSPEKPKTAPKVTFSPLSTHIIVDIEVDRERNTVTQNKVVEESNVVIRDNFYDEEVLLEASTSRPVSRLTSKPSTANKSQHSVQFAADLSQSQSQSTKTSDSMFDMSTAVTPRYNAVSDQTTNSIASNKTSLTLTQPSQTNAYAGSNEDNHPSGPVKMKSFSIDNTPNDSGTHMYEDVVFNDFASDRPHSVNITTDNDGGVNEMSGVFGQSVGIADIIDMHETVLSTEYAVEGVVIEETTGDVSNTDKISTPPPPQSTIAVTETSIEGDSRSPAVAAEDDDADFTYEDDVFENEFDSPAKTHNNNTHGSEQHYQDNTELDNASNEQPQETDDNDVLFFDSDAVLNSANTANTQPDNNTHYVDENNTDEATNMVFFNTDSDLPSGKSSANNNKQVQESKYSESLSYEEYKETEMAGVAVVGVREEDIYDYDDGEFD